MPEYTPNQYLRMYRNAIRAGQIRLARARTAAQRRRFQNFINRNVALASAVPAYYRGRNVGRRRMTRAQRFIHGHGQYRFRRRR